MHMSMCSLVVGSIFALVNVQTALAAASVSSSTESSGSQALLLFAGLILLIGWSRANRRAARVLVHDRRKSRDW